MSTISVPVTFSPNTTISSSDVNNCFSTIYNDYNGGISAANLAAGAVTTTKIADSNVTTAKIADSAVTTAKIAANAVTYAKLAAGVAVQVASTLSGAVATGTTVIPHDDTIPQNTEGDQYLSLSITPKATTNLLVIEALVYLSSSAASNNLIVALFQDSTANALAASEQQATGTSTPTMVPLRYTMTAGTTSSTTFKIRCGGSAAATTTFNGTVGARKFGGITLSSLKITEYTA